MSRENEKGKEKGVNKKPISPFFPLPLTSMATKVLMVASRTVMCMNDMLWAPFTMFLNPARICGMSENYIEKEQQEEEEEKRIRRLGRMGARLTDGGRISVFA